MKGHEENSGDVKKLTEGIKDKTADNLESMASSMLSSKKQEVAQTSG